MKLQTSEFYLNRRFWYICYAAIIALVYIMSYLCYLQLGKNTLFTKKSMSNYTRVMPILPARGNITDKTGNLLATNRIVNSISWQGTGNRYLTNSQQTMLLHLKKLLQLSSEIEQRIRIAERTYTNVTLAHDIPLKNIQKLFEQFPHEDNIRIEQTYKRLYPYNTYACHIIGYVTNHVPNIIGKTGLERFCNTELEGQPGQLCKQINSFGKLLHSQIISTPVQGKTIETTLDISTQMLLEDLFPKDVCGASVLMDPYSGAIEALISRPAYNPNIFINSISNSLWQELQMKQCLLNRASRASYPPASIFKLVTLAAALEEHIIDIDSTWTCKGHVRFGGRTTFCGRRRGHGLLNTTEALAYSCNIPFYELAKVIPIDTIAYYAQILGLGLKTNFILGETVGNIPTVSWKQAKLGEPWWPGESLSASIGQSYLLVTPLQIAQMIGALYTGFITHPRILQNEPIIAQPIRLSNGTQYFLKEAMAAVAQKGTARILNNLKDFTFYAKTGTAQTCNRSLDKNNKKQPHVWFAACFTYKNRDPRILILLLEHAPSIRTVIQVAYRFFQQYAKHLDHI